MGSPRQHAMERRQKPKGKARTLGGPLLGPDDRPIPRRRPTGTRVPQGMSPRRKSSPEAVAKARAAYAEMMKRRAEARNKRPPPMTAAQRRMRMDLMRKQAQERARKLFNDSLKRKTATYNKTKATKPSAKPVPKGIKGYPQPKSLRNLADLLKKPIKTAAGKKGISPSVIKKMQDANKKMQARLFGGGKRPTSKRTFART